MIMELNELAKETVPAKKERLEKILTLLADGPTCSSAEEAHSLIHASFETVENAHDLEGDNKMGISDLESMPTTSYEGRTLYFEEFTRHVLFMAENGAIDIRIRDDKVNLKTILKQQQAYPKERLQSVLEKSGFDGKGVWDK